MKKKGMKTIPNELDLRLDEPTKNNGKNVKSNKNIWEYIEVTGEKMKKEKKTDIRNQIKRRNRAHVCTREKTKAPAFAGAFVLYHRNSIDIRKMWGPVRRAELLQEMKPLAQEQFIYPKHFNFLWYP